MPSDDAPEIELRDGGLLEGGRERAILIPCGQMLLVSESLWQRVNTDAKRALQGVAQRHMSRHTEQSPWCVEPGTATWWNAETKTEMTV